MLASRYRLLSSEQPPNDVLVGADNSIYLLKGINYLSAPDLDLHPDSIAYRDRIIAAGGSINDSTLKALNDLVVIPLQSVKAKFRGFYPFLGNSLAASMIQLWGSLPLLPVNYVEADYSQATGLKGNGTSKYANTQIIASTLSIGNAGFLSYGREFEGTNTSSFFVLGGIYDNANGGNNFVLSNRSSTPGLSAACGNNTGVLSGGAFINGFAAFSATANNLLKIYINGVEVISSSTTRSINLGNRSIFLGARNDNGSPFYFSAFRFRTAAVTEGLSDSEIADIYTRIHQFNSAIGRPA